ncbi:MAG: hypothetical protein GDA36_09155 [Rhodobacteraceae bacterium]|nr:hypothetical protein [Paracoccaceae bacterium]
MFRSVRRISFATAVASLLVASTSANVGHIVSVNVVDGGMTQNGTYLAALHLTLAEGWKTYWRVPGDAGIPPSFNWRGSRNVAATRFTWPTPDVFDQNGIRSIGYENELVLPVEITPQNAKTPVRIKGRMDLGICGDVCIPASIRFDETLDPDADRSPAIVAALSQRPFSETEAGVQDALCRITPTDSGLRIEVRITMPSAGEREVAVIEPGNPKVWASEPETARHGGVLIAASDLVHVEQTGYVIDRSKVRITVLGSSHAVDIQGCAAD